MSAFMLVFISGLLFGAAFGAFLWIPLTLHRCGLEQKQRCSSCGVKVTPRIRLGTPIHNHNSASGYSGSTPVRIVRPSSKGASS